MTAILAEVALPSPMNSRSDKALAELVHNPKIIRVSADANDHDNHTRDHTIDKEVVDVNHSTAAVGTAGTAVVSQVRVCTYRNCHIVGNDCYIHCNSQ